MKENENLLAIRRFLNNDELTGTDLKLKEHIVSLDYMLTSSRQELIKLNESLQASKNAVNVKTAEVISVSDKLQSLCELAIELENSVDTDVEADAISETEE